MRKRIISIILLFAVLCLCEHSSVEGDKDLILQKAKEHLRTHSIIHEYIIDEMATTIEISSEIKEVVFHYFPFSEPIISVYFDNCENIVSCNCLDLKVSKYEHDLDYFFDMREAAQASAVWEREYGPHEFWDVNINAAFYSQYHFYPNETQQMYENRQNSGCIFPTEDSIDPDIALNIANQILKNHLYCDDNKIALLKTGMTLYNDPMVYCIEYYYDIDMMPVLEYVVYLFAKDGTCLSADFRNFESEYSFPLQSLDGIYWSEYYDMVKFEDGSFQRVEKETMRDDR